MESLIESLAKETGQTKFRSSTTTDNHVMDNSMHGDRKYTLFGGSKAWNEHDWTSSDDRVRGGKSQSYLECTDKIGRFHGNLDIKTLGGAGFASQRTTAEDSEWDLSHYAGIELCVAKGDKKRYTFNLKDELLERDPETGREQASISYECDFELPPQAEPGDTEDRTVFIPWSAFNATYRGKPKKDAGPINLKKIKRFSIMMRSFFGTQEGDFSLSLRSICALRDVPKHDDPDVYTDLEKGSHGSLPASTPASFNAQPRVHRRNAFLILGAISLYALYLLYSRHPLLCG